MTHPDSHDPVLERLDALLSDPSALPPPGRPAWTREALEAKARAFLSDDDILGLRTVLRLMAARGYPLPDDALDAALLEDSGDGEDFDEASDFLMDLSNETALGARKAVAAQLADRLSELEPDMLQGCAVETIARLDAGGHLPLLRRALQSADLFVPDGAVFGLVENRVAAAAADLHRFLMGTDAPDLASSALAGLVCFGKPEQVMQGTAHILTLMSEEQTQSSPLEDLAMDLDPVGMGIELHTRTMDALFPQTVDEGSDAEGRGDRGHGEGCGEGCSHARGGPHEASRPRGEMGHGEGAGRSASPGGDSIADRIGSLIPRTDPQGAGRGAKVLTVERRRRIDALAGTGDAVKLILSLAEIAAEAVSLASGDSADFAALGKRLLALTGALTREGSLLGLRREDREHGTALLLDVVAKAIRGRDVRAELDKGLTRERVLDLLRVDEDWVSRDVFSEVAALLTEEDLGELAASPDPAVRKNALALLAAIGPSKHVGPALEGLDPNAECDAERMRSAAHFGGDAFLDAAVEGILGGDREAWHPMLLHFLELAGTQRARKFLPLVLDRIAGKVPLSRLLDVTTALADAEVAAELIERLETGEVSVQDVRRYASAREEACGKLAVLCDLADIDDDADAVLASAVIAYEREHGDTYEEEGDPDDVFPEEDLEDEEDEDFPGMEEEDDIWSAEGGEEEEEDEEEEEEEEDEDEEPFWDIEDDAPETAEASPPPRPEVPKAAKPMRNDPCPCGSGKKYKNCCGK